MPRFTPGENFNDGEQLNAARLNNHVASAIPVDGLIADLPEIEVGNIANDDYLMILDSSGNQLYKTKKEDFLYNIPPTFVSEITATPDTGEINIGYNTGNINIGNALFAANEGATMSISVKSLNISAKTIDIGAGGDGVHPSLVNIGSALNSVANGGILYGNLIPSTYTHTASGYGSITQIGKGSTANRPNLTYYKDVIGDTDATQANMAGILRLNTDTSKIEWYDGTNWKTPLSEGEIKYKNYIKSHYFSCPTNWTNLVWAYETPQQIQVPSGETWTYEWCFAPDSRPNAGDGNDWVEYYGDFVIYNDTTEVKRKKMYYSAKAGVSTSVLIAHTFTSLDTPTARKIRARFEHGTSTRGGVPNSAIGTVKLTIRPSSDDAFVNANL